MSSGYITFYYSKWNKTRNQFHFGVFHVNSYKRFTAWKVSKYGVISGPYLDTFHAVIIRTQILKRFISHEMSSQANTL